MIQDIISKIEKEIEVRKNMPHPHEQVDICYGLNRAKELVSSVQGETVLCCGITECCLYDFGPDISWEKKPKFCPICGKKITKIM